MAKSILIALRLPTEWKEKIDKLVKAGKYKNFSDAIKTAVQKFLECEIRKDR